MSAPKGLPFVLAWRKSYATKDSVLTATQRHVADALSLHMDAKGGSCYPSIPTLADESGYSKRTVELAVTAIVDAGFLRREVGGGRGRGDVSHYEAVIPDPVPERAKDVRPSETEKGEARDPKGRISRQKRAKDVRPRKPVGGRKADYGPLEDTTSNRAAALARDARSAATTTEGEDMNDPLDTAARELAPFGVPREALVSLCDKLHDSVSFNVESHVLEGARWVSRYYRPEEAVDVVSLIRERVETRAVIARAERERREREQRERTGQREPLLHAEVGPEDPEAPF